MYELTDAGRQAAHDWLISMLATTRNEFPQFPAALSFLMMLSPAEARAALEQRGQALRAELASIEADLQNYSSALPRVVLMDDEYRRAVTGAEVAWLQGIIDDLRDGSWSWSYEDFAGMAAALQPDGESVTEPPG